MLDLAIPRYIPTCSTLVGAEVLVFTVLQSEFMKHKQ